MLWAWPAFALSRYWYIQRRRAGHAQLHVCHIVGVIIFEDGSYSFGDSHYYCSRLFGLLPQVFCQCNAGVTCAGHYSLQGTKEF